MQTELARKGHETQEEQKRMTELVEKLQSQLSQNECDLKSRETQLRRQQVKSSRNCQSEFNYLGEFRSIECRFAVSCCQSKFLKNSIVVFRIVKGKVA